MVQNSRRSFMKKALVAGGVVVTASVAVASKDKSGNDKGVVSGKSTKKEILYKRSQEWNEYYKAAH